MCGIFGIVSSRSISKSDTFKIANYVQQRGRDSSGLFLFDSDKYNIHKANTPLVSLLKSVNLRSVPFIMGHSRLITNGLSDNQPVYRDDISVIHNGIIVNDLNIWEESSKKRNYEIDTEVIPALFSEYLVNGLDLKDAASKILSRCKGVIACAAAFPKLGKLVLFSNNGSLFHGMKGNDHYFASEHYPLSKVNCTDIIQIFREPYVIDIPVSTVSSNIIESKYKPKNLIPNLGNIKSEASLLKYYPHKLRRCTKCILPETMPFIQFDRDGVCNYCNNYKIRNKPKPLSDLFSLIEPYRRKYGSDCIVPFSGGRDSCYGLHLIVKELGMSPITYTYDWGMVTDLGRRNISRMCSQLGVENIIVAANIARKRKNIAKNLSAWLKSPNLGMISILTSGDKHFFRYVESVKAQTGISLNLWGVNPLEVTHFKSGFLGVPPNFAEKLVYTSGFRKQLRYQNLRFKAMLNSPSYFNSSLWDTFSGEYYRSFHKKTDYFHIFDYWRWDEKVIDNCLIGEYEWEKAIDTTTTWRIGDGTAAFYNYIYYSVAGFTEHDTFRSNQIREGDITREMAIKLVEDENRPRYENIKWYLDAIGMDYCSVINRINAIPSMY